MFAALAAMVATQGLGVLRELRQVHRRLLSLAGALWLLMFGVGFAVLGRRIGGLVA